MFDKQIFLLSKEPSKMATKKAAQRDEIQGELRAR